MLDLQRNFMISVMGGFSNYEAFHIYSQHSKNPNGLVFDIFNGIGSKIEKGAESSVQNVLPRCSKPWSRVTVKLFIPFKDGISKSAKSRPHWKSFGTKLLALNELATCPNSNFEEYGSDTVSIIFHVGSKCGVEGVQDRGLHPKMLRMGNRRTWSKKSNNFIIGIGCGLENSEKKDFDDFIRKVFPTVNFLKILIRSYFLRSVIWAPEIKTI